MTTLSPQELHFAKLFVTGKTYKQIAAIMGISVSATSSTARRVHLKLGTRNCADLFKKLNGRPA